jgi:hypothetical protein
MKTKQQLISEIKESGAIYVTYGSGDMVIPIDEALTDIGAMDEESIADGDWMRLTERATMLYSNTLEWYVVTYEESVALKHRTDLSEILECGYDQSDYGIAKIEQCWNGENLTDADDWV